MTDNFIKLVLRAFNGECDASVMKVKYSNVQTMENRVRKTYDDLNKLSKTTHCDITSSYLNLKLQELWLTHEYQEKKYQEQEEQRIIREQMREEEKALRELEKIQQDAEREEYRYQDALVLVLGRGPPCGTRHQFTLRHRLENYAGRSRSRTSIRASAIPLCDTAQRALQQFLVAIGASGSPAVLSWRSCERKEAS